MTKKSLNEGSKNKLLTLIRKASKITGYTKGNFYLLAINQQKKYTGYVKIAIKKYKGTRNKFTKDVENFYA